MLSGPRLFRGCDGQLPEEYAVLPAAWLRSGNSGQCTGPPLSRFRNGVTQETINAGNNGDDRRSGSSIADRLDVADTDFPCKVQWY